MALIGTIRKNSWLLIIMVGGALAAFVLMDMFGNQGGPGGGAPTTVGNINGRNVDIREFTNAEKIQQFLYGSSPTDAGFGRRNVLWNYYIEDALVRQEADKLGLTVSRDELLDLQFGASPSPIIANRFRNPNTQQLDRQRLAQFQQALNDGTLSQDPNWGPVWKYQQDEIIKDRLQTKISNMVRKGLYTPTWMVEQLHLEQSQNVTFGYVKIPFDEVEVEAEPTESDYQDYLNEHEGDYAQEEETRKVSYVVLEVTPTSADSQMIRQSIADLIPTFRSTDDDSTFVANNFGFIDEAYYKKEDLAAVMNNEIVDSLYEVVPGTVIGPFIDGGTYRAIKVLDQMIVPDSVKTRHILRQADPNNPLAFAQANKTIDSLKTLLDAGTHQFDSLAIKFSQDYSNSSNGGELGYAFINQMVKPFNDLIFFSGKAGNAYKIETQFGVHLVEIQDKKYLNNEKGVKLAYINQPIVPSEETQSAIKERARDIVRKNRTLDKLAEAVAANDEIEIQTSAPLKLNDYIVGDLGSGQDSRSIVKWAFNGNTSIGDISPEVYSFQDPINYFDNKYVIAALKSIIPKGIPSVAEIKEEIDLQVINKKKAQLIKEQIGSKDLSSIASTFNSQVDTARNVTFSANSVTGLGNEPKVIATAFNLDLNTISSPIEGNNGVYVIKVISKPDAQQGPTNIPQIRQAENSKSQAKVGNQLIQAMKKTADIEDYRSRFY